MSCPWKQLLPELQRAAELIASSRALVITAGAGMSSYPHIVDSTSADQFWERFPQLQDKGVTLQTMCKPDWFLTDPRFAWGFYAHRYNDYKTLPLNQGFHILHRWAAGKDRGHFVFTSNVDCRFQRAGFTSDNIVECHGSVDYMQCVDVKQSKQIWLVPPSTEFTVDSDNMRLTSELPRGPPGSSFLARPNICMYKDRSWLRTRVQQQERRLVSYLQGLGTETPVVVEIGAGTNFPTVRNFSQLVVQKYKGVLVRINPMEPRVEATEDISIPLAAVDALRVIDNIINNESIS